MRKLSRFAGLAFCFSAVASVALAEGHVAALRFSSLDAVLADAVRMSALSGEPKSREELFEESVGPLGLKDRSWIDGSRPIVVALPAQGLMNMGWVGALPVKQVDSALAALESRLGAPQVSDGLHTFSTILETEVHVRPVGDYLVFGQEAGAVRGADLKQLLDVGDLPPGNVALDLDLIPLTAMFQLGMAAGRQAVSKNLDLDESDEAGREAAMEMFDLYVGMVNDLLLNTRRLQISFEVGSETLTFHKRLLPRADSTLAGLLKAQKGGFPEIAHRVEAKSAVAVMVSGIDLTEASRTALKEYARSYTKLTTTLSESTSDDGNEWWLALIDPWSKTAGKWIDCVRGDTAASYHFGAESGFGAVQIARLNGDEGCAGLLDDIATALAQIPELPDGGKLVTVTEDALVHGGVHSVRLDLDVLAVEGEEDAEAREAASQLLGGDTYVYYLGMKDDVLISAAGAGAEQAFKTSVDRLSSRKKRGGITAAMFEPTKAGEGLFLALDAALLLRELSRLDPEDEELQELIAIADKAGRWVFGAHLQPDALRFELSLPLSTFELFAVFDDDEEETEVEEHDADPAQPDGADRS